MTAKVSFYLGISVFQYILRGLHYVVLFSFKIIVQLSLYLITNKKVTKDKV